MSDLETRPPAADAGNGLKRNAIGTGGIAFLVISAAAPLTVMAGVAPVAIGVGGIGAPMGYVIAGVVLLIFAISFMAMTKHVKAAGGFYTYITLAMGKTVGLASAILAIVSYNCLQIGVYGLFAVQTQSMLRALFGWDVPWPVVALVAIAAVWFLGYRGIDVGAKVLGVLLIAETAILAIMGFGILARGGAQGISFASFSPEHAFTPGVLAILAVCFAAFMGFESTVLYRREARNPDTSVPRATYIAVGFMSVFYAFIVWTVIQAFGDGNVVAAAGELADGMFFATINHYVGPWAEVVMYVLIVTSVYASQLAFHNAINRYVYMLAKDGVLPAFLGRTHPKYKSPHRAGQIQTILAAIVIIICAIAGADPYKQLLIWVNTPGIFGIVALQGLVSVAAFIYLRRNPAAATNRLLIPVSVASAILLFGVVALIAINIELLTFADALTNTILLLVTPVVFLAGLLIARRLRTTRPDVFARIGSFETHDS
ncbi:APC family permease [Paenarthrobacter aurescens]|uniref:Amino acid permease n=1 Tax=Paenarthrobacter aurescens TaxID=43663 RepID=A0A4Y3ND92_PAEAU|nr:APC family permease [Paenarthrobacter aurescens]MDO6143480.1 APC family permease [Paenarthrobacter aurescens]MDO6147328.1 APC family permease [Paenarthrobacter aurescens]MDO6158572.1 APC family permease [Paenarthrobacter aurescens]MDO6162555.1 APC family permease [Paenarthrobacter aurescens]GEB19914.1 amino acid permease [Paenarthrobacter aurescens]